MYKSRLSSQSAASQFHNQNAARHGRSPIVFLGATLFACVLFAFGVLFLYFGAQLPPSLPIPTPNAYDQMVRLTRSVKDVPNDLMEADADQLKSFISTAFGHTSCGNKPNRH